MIRSIVSIIILWALSCGNPKEKHSVIGTQETIISSEESSDSSSETTVITKEIEPLLPKGAIVGDYNGDLNPFYAKVSHVNFQKEITYISFENKSLRTIEIPKTYGGMLSSMTLEGFDRDLLLVTAQLKDPNFNKYFLYVLRDGQWKSVMNGFAIHHSNMHDSLRPIRPHPEDPNQLLRNYSVFSLDASDPLGYTWLLMEESVPIQNR
jgi:hypothetical protein